MTSAADRLAHELLGRLGDKVVTSDRAALAPWLTDWRGRWTGEAAALVQPGSTEEVSTIVAAANEAGVPLVPQGGNTSMVGGATPPEEGGVLLLSLRRMNRIRSLDEHARVAVCESGVVLETLHEAATARGLRFPLTLGSKGSATIGGLVSTNAGGTQVLRFGTMRGLVAGLEAVLPDGSVHDGLSGLKKDNRGFSLDQLLIGAEGTLGVVTAARLKLAVQPADHATALCGLEDPAAALALLQRLEGETDQVEGFELIPHDSLEAGLRHLSMKAPLARAHGHYVLIEATGNGDEPSATLLERLLGEALADGLIADATVAATEAKSAALWRLRDGLSDAEKQVYGLATQHDISVPVEAMPAFLEEVEDKVEARWPGVDVSGYGHLGDGNIHLHVRAMTRGSDDWREGEGVEIERFVHDLVVAHGGSISAEHGIGQMKRDELARLGEPARLHAMRAIKAALDPNGIMNPGKLVP
ncbi:FAD-binding oxidoreductase [Sphingomicrobium nitratireducens]|uniref:FAD-binding oxidoreductase n=1 Tax=Sphingomicrobium nitratireducens TaxID=2964666 RepID=UPI00224031B1|nr:FAD-binding oxidoreductase [Sphingomicrobium nitratireducens]